MKNKTIKRLIPIFLLFIFACGHSLSENNTYGIIKPSDYLSGRFKAQNFLHKKGIVSKKNIFVELNAFGIKTDGRKHYLRLDTAINLKRMLAAFKKDHPTIKIWIQSATRSFYSQKWIWEAKFNGKRLVDGKNLKKTIKNHRLRALKILNYSSMPGTSRHHWGTDFDINRLNNSYYKKGKGKIIFKWLKAHGSTYGFGQPYTAGRKLGYLEERWHWSYLPLSKIFLKDWVELFKKNPKLLVIPGSYAGSTASANLASLYVTSISPSCK